MSTETINYSGNKKKNAESIELRKFPKAIAFLESMQRNSLKTKNTYASGLVHFQSFMAEKYPDFDIDTILGPLQNNTINVYELLDDFVSYLTSKPSNKYGIIMTSVSIRLYLASIRSYLGYYDMDVIPSKFKRKVKMPKVYREDEEPLDVSDIRKILFACNNRRLKAYLLVIASGAMRAVEGLAIRLKDIDLSKSPTKIHIRKEYSKTKVARNIYISDETTIYLKQWLEWKYNNHERPRKSNPEDLVFTLNKDTNPNNIYIKIWEEHEKLLKTVGLDERKEGMKGRRKITLHSYRRFAKTVISDQVNQDYSEWFLGHSKSPYYTKKEAEKREIYATKCMKYLTFLDYTTLEATGKNIEAKLSEKEKEIQLLKQRDSMNTDAIVSLSDQLANVIKEIEILKEQK